MPYARIIITVLFLFFVRYTPCLSQTYQKDSLVVKELTTQILRYKNAWMNDDVETAIAMTHPEIIEKMGGPERMRQSFGNGKELRTMYKMRYTGFEFDSPDSILVLPQSYQVAFPVVLTTAFEDGSTQNDSRVMVGYGDIASSKWYFIAIPPGEIEKAKEALGFLDAGLSIPK